MEAILAVSKNGVVGVGNKLPWYFKEDLKHFKEYTRDKHLIAGTTTVLGLPPLPNRHLVQFSRYGNKEPQCHDICHTVECAFNKYPTAIVIGGPKTIYCFLPFIQKITLTILDIEVPNNIDNVTIDLGTLLKGFEQTNIYVLSENAIVKEFKKCYQKGQLDNA